MLVVIGASHRDLELADLERLSATPRLAGALRDLAGRAGSPIAGWVLLATCNRLEIYLDAARFHDGIDGVLDAVSAASGVPVGEVAGQLQVRAGSQVATHLFRVAAGLDSMVVGEAEISGQVAAALRRAQSTGSVSPVLNLLFQSAAHTAKRVATDTDLNATGRSVASVALGEVEARIGPLSDARVLLVGTGAYARVVAAALQQRGCTDVGVYSARGRQADFARTRGLRAIAKGELARELAACALVVTCNGTGTPVLDRAVVEPALARRSTPLSIVDLALRSDVPEDVRALSGVVVTGLHSAAPWGGAAPEAVRRADDVVVDAVDEFERELAVRRLDPAVVALRNHVTGTVRRELERLRRRVPADVAAEVELAAHRMARSLLHTPTIRARMLARSGEGSDYLRALHTLFGIDVSALGGDGAFGDGAIGDGALGDRAALGDGILGDRAALGDAVGDGVPEAGAAGVRPGDGLSAATGTMAACPPRRHP